MKLVDVPPAPVDIEDWMRQVAICRTEAQRAEKGLRYKTRKVDPPRTMAEWSLLRYGRIKCTISDKN